MDLPKAALVLLALIAAPLAATAETRMLTFNNDKALEAWSLSGPVSIDPAQGRGSLKVAPGGRAVLTLRDTDGAGMVKVRVYDNGSTRANQGEYGNGPLIGVMNAEGRVLTIGPVFAKYLTGNTRYYAGEYMLRNERPWYGLTDVGVGRSKGWHEWTFRFDPKRGVQVLHNGKDVDRPKQRFDRSKSDMKGFSGVVVVGDDSQTDGQTVWVDNLRIAISEEIRIDPLERIVPKTDPVVAEAPGIVPELMDKHPRLLFGAEDVPRLRAFAKTPEGKLYYDTLMSYLGSSGAPKDTKFLTDATEAQRQGLWRLPTVALHYVLTGDKRSFDRTVEFMEFLLAQPHWETNELDNGMGAANIMIGAALAYDWLYNDLDPQFREKYREKLWQHARRMYHGGHLMNDKRGHVYWEMDPQNNHRWHRNAGFALCALAAYTGEDHQKWLMKSLHDELEFIVDWLPEDGTSHEGPGYMIFGAAHLMLGVQAGDRCFGTDWLQRPFFANLPRFMTQTLTPGLTHRFNFGDMAGVDVGALNYNVYELLAAGLHGRADELAAANTIAATKGVSASIGWLGLLWYPQDATAGSVENLPDTDFFPDLGTLFVREGWAKGGAAAMFRCGPFGGYLLNRYRMQNNYHGVNVAHDDPDANSFTLFKDDAFVAETDRYSMKKQSSNLNTILVNGIGQTVVGRGEPQGYWQPAARGADMTEIAVVTALARSGENVAIEGEAAGSYPQITKDKKRPALERFRRSFLWVEGKYVLVLDDIRAPRSVDIDWLMQAPQLEAISPRAGRYVLRNGDAACPFMTVADARVAGKIVDSTADNRQKPLGWKQLRLRAKGRAVRFASVYDLWGRGGLTVKVIAKGRDHATVVVTADGIRDVWDWAAGAGRFEPSKIVGRTKAKQTILTLSEPEPQTRELIDEVKEHASR